MLSIRCSSEDENLIKKFAAIKKQSVSEFLRQAALEKIEDEYDLKLVKDYLEKKVDGGKIYGISQDKYFIDIGIPADFERAQKELLAFH